MDRRESLKTLFVGSVAGALLVNGCSSAEKNEYPALEKEQEDYGRTPEEAAYDKKLLDEKFFTEHELETIAVLSDLILPATNTAGSATAAGVPEFVEFMAKDIPAHKLPLRGGIMWLDHHAIRQYQQEFASCREEEQKAMLDQIAYPDKFPPEVAQGVRFFSLMRNLTLTGYYTTKMGIEDLGYKGNTPNVWDGVPDEVLQEHGMSYEKEWLAKCVDQTNRTELARWDSEGNLLS